MRCSVMSILAPRKTAQMRRCKYVKNAETAQIRRIKIDNFLFVGYHILALSGADKYINAVDTSSFVRVIGA